MPNLRPILTSSNPTSQPIRLVICLIGLGILYIGLNLTLVTQTKAAENLPPYEQSLRRLGTIVGALMYLDPLCNQTSAEDWYNNMSGLLDAENADDIRRRNITDRFNRSYRTLARTYKSCNSQAAKIAEIYHAEGQALLTQLKLKHVR